MLIQAADNIKLNSLHTSQKLRKKRSKQVKLYVKRNNTNLSGKKNNLHLGSKHIIFTRWRRPGLNGAIQCFLNGNYWKNEIYIKKSTKIISAQLDEFFKSQQAQVTTT